MYTRGLIPRCWRLVGEIFLEYLETCSFLLSCESLKKEIATIFTLCYYHNFLACIHIGITPQVLYIMSIYLTNAPSTYYLSNSKSCMWDRGFESYWFEIIDVSVVMQVKAKYQWSAAAKVFPVLCHHNPPSIVCYSACRPHPASHTHTLIHPLIIPPYPATPKLPTVNKLISTTLLAHNLSPTTYCTTHKPTPTTSRPQPVTNNLPPTTQHLLTKRRSLFNFTLLCFVKLYLSQLR